jgi:hypothetical protein
MIDCRASELSEAFFPMRDEMSEPLHPTARMLYSFLCSEAATRPLLWYADYLVHPDELPENVVRLLNEATNPRILRSAAEAYEPWEPDAEPSQPAAVEQCDIGDFRPTRPSMN